MLLALPEGLQIVSFIASDTAKVGLRGHKYGEQEKSPFLLSLYKLQINRRLNYRNTSFTGLNNSFQGVVAI